MDLKGNKITIGEIIADPAGKEVLQAEMPDLVKMQMFTKKMTLEAIISDIKKKGGDDAFVNAFVEKLQNA